MHECWRRLLLHSHDGQHGPMDACSPLSVPKAGLHRSCKRQPTVTPSVPVSESMHCCPASCKASSNNIVMAVLFKIIFDNSGLTQDHLAGCARPGS